MHFVSLEKKKLNVNNSHKAERKIMEVFSIEKCKDNFSGLGFFSLKSDIKFCNQPPSDSLYLPTANLGLITGNNFLLFRPACGMSC